MPKNKKEIKELVESWNWNLGIFEIYDEIKDWPTEVQTKVLKRCVKVFGDENKNFKDLSYHLNADL